MNDIVERLRRFEGSDDLGDGDFAVCVHAADEIERLRAERDMWRQENLKKQIACEQMGARIVTLEAERDEAVAALALYRAEHGCTRGQRTTQWCGEATKVRRAWLRVIQAENSCPASGGGCLAKRCGCVAEMEMLIGEAGHE